MFDSRPADLKMYEYVKGQFMKTFRVLSYRAERDGHCLDDGISLWTKLFNWKTPPYSHAEIWLLDEDKCFTSTMRGEWNGTVIRPASEVLTHPERWDYFEIQVEVAVYNAAVQKARLAAEANKGYDKPALLSFFFPIRFGSKGKDICSEVTERFLVWCDVFDKETKPSPRRLARNLMRLGYRPIHLKAVA